MILVAFKLPIWKFIQVSSTLINALDCNGNVILEPLLGKETSRILGIHLYLAVILEEV